MKKSIAKITSMLALIAAFNGAVLAGSAYAWSWGADNQENYQFNPANRQEILQYGAQIGADWPAQLRQQNYASERPQQAGNYGQRGLSSEPRSTN